MQQHKGYKIQALWNGIVYEVIFSTHPQHPSIFVAQLVLNIPEGTLFLSLDEAANFIKNPIEIWSGGSKVIAEDVTFNVCACFYDIPETPNCEDDCRRYESSDTKLEAEWVQDKISTNRWGCSNCKDSQYFDKTGLLKQYCGNCGAKMRNPHYVFVYDNEPMGLFKD